MSNEVEETRERIMQAAVRCAEASSVGGFSLEDVAASAGVSRTTIYRYFPGGRPQLVQETATWEIARFWARLAEAVEDLPTLEEQLVAGLVIGRKLIQKSQLLENMVESEMLELVTAVQPSEPLVHGVIRDYMRDLLIKEQVAGRLRPGMTPELGADYLMRMTLSWMASPTGLDLSDQVATHSVIRTQFLAGVLIDSSEAMPDPEFG
ncbi:transcriptional regulator, TetR family [Actinobacteria bacterium IMCC26207]|nr:transcriptional regulator, TetR family [Actinobacteria bacterium IMCC26207]